ncbi:MAG: hypothetical protein AB1689_01605 [Thermodesulfobacteriota bacterium]
MLALHARDPGLHRVLFEEAPLPPRLRARVANLERTMAAEVAALLEEHGVPRAEAPVAARLAVEVLESLTHRLVLHDVAREPAPAGTGAERHAREITRLLMGYLESKRGAPGPRRAAGR